ncbi:MAG: hypothetical protein GX163_11280 [Bacteroidetes bacterium]|nr:hypothetical protein [Bacteroidota bacterium]
MNENIKFNVYEKMNQAKLALQAARLKKSGRNDFSKYDYFELQDFLPMIIQLESELKFTCVVCFGVEQASLEIVDTEKPEDTILYTCPMSSASLKGMHEVQNLGAVQTYIKRYLYVNAFEIVEQDAIDKSQPESRPSRKSETTKSGQTLTNQQLAEFKKVIDQDDDPDTMKKRLKELVISLGYEKLSEVKTTEYKKLMDAFTSFGLPFDMGDL